MFRILSLLIGYLLGNILTAELVSRRISGQSAFDIGSGNPGMANIASQYGVRAGAAVLIGDLAKTFIACLLCRMIFSAQDGATACAYAGLGCISGHNYPVRHHFKGGKGVSCTCAALVSLSFGYGILACAVGGIAMLISGRLSVGAIAIPIAFLAPAFIACGNEAGVVVLIMTVIMLSRHLPHVRTEQRKDYLKKLKARKKTR